MIAIVRDNEVVIVDGQTMTMAPIGRAVTEENSGVNNQTTVITSALTGQITIGESSAGHQAITIATAQIGRVAIGETRNANNQTMAIVAGAASGNAVAHPPVWIAVGETVIKIRAIRKSAAWQIFFGL